LEQIRGGNRDAIGNKASGTLNAAGVGEQGVETGRSAEKQATVETIAETEIRDALRH
jgi:hypothetical protein